MYYNKEELNKIGYHFILGAPRSGTTLLTSLLNNHSKITTAYEGKFLLHFLNSLGNKSNYDVKELQNFIDALSHPKIDGLKFMRFWIIDRDSLLKNVQELLPTFPYINLCKLVYLNNHTAQGKQAIKHVIDKNPLYCIYANKLEKKFTDSKFIGIIRDYKDSIASRKIQQKKNTKSIIPICLLWKKSYSEYLKLQENHSKKTHLVKYEDLVLHTEQEFKKIITFLDLEFESSHLIMPTHQKENLEASLTKLNENEKKRFLKTFERSVREIDASSIDNWRNQLSKKEIRIADYICGATAIKFGYPESKSKVSLIEKMVILGFQLKFSIELRLNKFYYNSPLALRKLLGKSLK